MKTIRSFRRILLFFVTACLSAAAVADEATSMAVLEKLDPAKATDAELLEATSACRDLTRIGTEKSVPALEKLLDDERTRDYARTALRNIGGERAETALKRHPAKKDNASPVDEKLKALRPKIERIHLGGVKGLDVFSTLLKSEDKAEFHAALQGFRRCPTRSIVDLLAREQATLKPERRVAAILSLLDRKDAAPLPPEIVETAKSDADDDVRAAALAVLGAFPDEEKIRLLFQASTGRNDKAAFDALETTTYPGIDTLLGEYVKSPDAALRISACMVAGIRGVKALEPELWAASRETHTGVRGAAFIALGRVVGKTGFAKLLDDYSATDFENVRQYVLAAVATACGISADRPAYAALIGEKISDPETRLGFLAELGGEDALKAIVGLAKTTGAEPVRDNATKILGEWTGADVAPYLLDLSKTFKERGDGRLHLRTLRGLVRVLRQFEMPKRDRFELASLALEIADRDEERKMLDVIVKRFTPKKTVLFDGASFTGWQGDTEKSFRIENGAIVGGNLEERIPRNEFLTTPRSYGDFVLTLRCKAVGDGCNGGIQFRSQRIPNHHEMIGYQADMDDAGKLWGNLYDESRRKKNLAVPDRAEVEKAFKKDDWNMYEIRCEGRRTQLFVNGVRTVDYLEPDATIPQTGVIGLQIHGGPPSETYYRDIVIETWD